MATERVEEQKELQVRDLLTSVYNNILQKYPHNKLVFEKPPESLIARDGDNHSWGRNREGWMIFENTARVRVAKQDWIVALATKRDGYAGGDFSCDLKAFKLEKNPRITPKFLEQVRTEIRNRHFFNDSLLVGTCYGGLHRAHIYPKWAPLSALVWETLANDYGELVSKPPEIDRGYESWIQLGYPLSEAVKSTVKFKPEALEVFSSACIKALEENSIAVTS